MADLLDFTGVRVFTVNAQPGAGYVAKFYTSGTTTPATVYTDETLGTAHGTSVTADAAGQFAAVWAASGDIKCVIEDGDGAVIQTIDPVFSTSSSSSAAADISFTPTVDLPFDNVQDAIEGAATSAASGYGAFGLGITGNADLLANIDATNIGAGTYRFGNTTTGTFPTGVAAVDTGLVEHWRQAAATAMQFLYHATTDRVFHRRMASSAWGTWREVITSNQAPAEGDILYRGASAWTRLAKGTAFQKLRTNSGATAPEWSAATQLALTSTGSGGPYTFTIPAGVTKIEVLFDRCSLDSSGNWFVQIGPSGGVETTGYESTSSIGASGVAATSGFVVQAAGASETVTGIMTLVLMNSGTNLWVAGHQMARTSGTGGIVGGGRIAIAGTLERLRLTFSGGNNPDGGQVRVQYE